MLTQYQSCLQLPEQLPESQAVGSGGDQVGVDPTADEARGLDPEEDRRGQEQQWLLVGQWAQGTVLGCRRHDP